MRIEPLVVYLQMRASDDLILRRGKVLPVKPRRGLTDRVQKANVLAPGGRIVPVVGRRFSFDFGVPRFQR